MVNSSGVELRGQQCKTGIGHIRPCLPQTQSLRNVPIRSVVACFFQGDGSGKGDDSSRPVLQGGLRGWQSRGASSSSFRADVADNSGTLSSTDAGDGRRFAWQWGVIWRTGVAWGGAGAGD